MSREIPLAIAVAGWFDGALGRVDDFETAHRIHMMADSAMWWLIIGGTFVALWSPQRYRAALPMVLIPFVAMALAMAVTDFWKLAPIVGIFGAVMLVATALHPSGRELIKKRAHTLVFRRESNGQ